jgi:hypothetical protein
MAKSIVAILLVLLVIYVVPFVVYGGASAAGLLAPPTSASPGMFLLGVLVTKLGTAVAFVIIFGLSKAIWGPRWLLFGLVWFGMFTCTELGEALSGRSTNLEAVLGVLSEAIYAPVSAFITKRLLWRGTVQTSQAAVRA